MKITNKQLKQIIKEELQKVLYESEIGPEIDPVKFKAVMSGGAALIAGTVLALNAISAGESPSQENENLVLPNEAIEIIQQANLSYRPRGDVIFVPTTEVYTAYRSGNITRDQVQDLRSMSYELQSGLNSDTGWNVDDHYKYDPRSAPFEIKENRFKKKRKKIKEQQKVLNEMDRDLYHFNKRRNQMDNLGGEVRLGSQSSTATPHPQRHKLYDLLRSGDPKSVRQAQSLAQAIDDPLDFKLQSGNFGTIDISYGTFHLAIDQAIKELKSKFPNETAVSDYEFYNVLKKHLPKNRYLSADELEEVAYNYLVDKDMFYRDYVIIRPETI